MEGRLVLDRFRLLDELGRGGFAVVYRAWDERLQREVAVKVLQHDPAARRVLREAQAAARLNHPAIATLYELGEDDERVYLVSELAEGPTLRTLLRTGELTDRTAGALGATLCEALAHAHERGIVHRDVKPENIAILLRESDVPGPVPETAQGPMLLDFGIASVAGEAALTRTGEVVGTLAYMAPEQAEGAPAEPPADVYSLALVLFEAWTGSNPVVRPTPAATARAIGEPLAPLGTYRPDLPHRLCEAIDAALDPEPWRRPRAADLGAELESELGRLEAAPVPSSSSTTATRSLAFGSIARAAVLVSLAAGLAVLAWAGGNSGLALLLACLGLPAVALVRPRAWLLPAAAPLLGWAGLAAAFPALAGALESPRRAALLGGLGGAWVAVGQVVVGRSLLFGAPPPAPAGWATSSASALELLGAALLTPAGTVVLAWAIAAWLLATILRLRGIVLRIVGALSWGAGVVAFQRLLAEGSPDPASGATVALIVCVLAIALWRGSTRAAVVHSGARRKRSAAVLEGGTA